MTTTLMGNQREQITGIARRGLIPAVQWTDVMDRLTPRAANNWPVVAAHFTQIRCRIQAQYSGSNAWPNEPLLVLAVFPHQIMPTRTHGDPNLPWHISLSSYDPNRRAQFKAIEEQWGKAREVTLRGWIAGATFQLDPVNCPVGSDPAVQAIHAADPHYGHIPLHVSL